MSRIKPTARGVPNKFPTNLPDLIAHLDTMCPEPGINSDQSIETIMFAAGRRDLVHQLRREYQRSLERPDST